jgi:hypothetical protein
VKYILSASVLALALAILIYALMPSYYLIVVSASSGDSPLAVVQMGPFATQAACERARRRVPDAIFGINLDEKTREFFSRRMVCLSSR